MPVLDGAGRLGISPAAITKPSLHPAQAAISRLKIKLGDLPRWDRSCLKQRPTQSWKLALHSSLPCEASILSFGIFGMQGGNEQQKGDFETPSFKQASWSSSPLRTKSWLWKASHLAFSNSTIAGLQIEAGTNQRVPHCRPLGRRWSSGAVMIQALGGGWVVFPISHTEILEIRINFVALALGRTTFHEPEKHKNLLGKTFFLSTSSTSDHSLHKHKAESRPEISHWACFILGPGLNHQNQGDWWISGQTFDFTFGRKLVAANRGSNTNIECLTNDAWRLSHEKVKSKWQSRALLLSHDLVPCILIPSSKARLQFKLAWDEHSCGTYHRQGTWPSFRLWQQIYQMERCSKPRFGCKNFNLIWTSHYDDFIATCCKGVSCVSLSRVQAVCIVRCTPFSSPMARDWESASLSTLSVFDLSTKPATQISLHHVLGDTSHKVKSLLLSFCYSGISNPCDFPQTSRKLRDPFVCNGTRFWPQVVATGNIKSWHRACPQGLCIILHSRGHSDQVLDVFSFACIPYPYTRRIWVLNAHPLCCFMLRHEDYRMRLLLKG